MPGPLLLRDARDDPFTHLNDQLFLFCHGDELSGRDQPARGMLPANQGFKPNHFLRQGIHLRLIMENELVVGDGSTQILFEVDPSGNRYIHGI